MSCPIMDADLRDVQRHIDDDFEPEPPLESRVKSRRYEATTVLDHAHTMRMAANPSLPVFVRLGFLAAGRAVANGHAPFGKGSLAELLGVAPKNLSRELKKAVAADMVLEGSTPTCLILPTAIQSRRPVPEGFVCCHGVTD